MPAGKPYTPLGELLDSYARRAPYNIRGPYRIARYLREQINAGVSGVSVAQWLNGESQPTRENMRTFTEVFGLTEDEKAELSYTYLYK